jgi:hypothetical protein
VDPESNRIKFQRWFIRYKWREEATERRYRPPYSTYKDLPAVGVPNDSRGLVWAAGVSDGVGLKGS